MKKKKDKINSGSHSWALKYSLGLLLVLFLIGIIDIQAQNPVLTDEEVEQYYEDLGIVLSEEEKTQIAEIVKPVDPLPQWRIDANDRIEQHRKAALAIEVLDADGKPIENAKVDIHLKRNAFNFGVVVRAEDLTDAKGRLANGGITSDQWKSLVLAMANSIGTGNNFKPRLSSLHEYLPGFLQWTNDNDLYVRGHLLIWPGSKGIEDMDKAGNVIGVDYGKHLSQGREESLNTIPGYEQVVSYDVEEAVLDFKNSNRTQADKNVVEEVVDAEISQWASLWDVKEWDVINETLSCRLLMDIMGYDQMAEWFKLAEENKVNPHAKLFLNEYKIISSPKEDASIPDYLSYELRKTQYMERIDRIIADGGPISGIGFQNRYKLGYPDPVITFERLEEFGSRYKLPMVGTEFEIIDDLENPVLPYDFSEKERARITEETLTTYFSQPYATGLFNWTFMSEEEEKALCYYDGSVKLNGLVWYYLHRIRYHTEEEKASDGQGKCLFNAYKGNYGVKVNYQGKEYLLELDLDQDKSYQIILDDVSTGMMEKLNEDEIFLHPNPVDRQLNINSPHPIQKIEIADLSGNVLHTQEYNPKIHLPQLPTGSYLLYCHLANGMVVKKLLKK